MEYITAFILLGILSAWTILWSTFWAGVPVFLFQVIRKRWTTSSRSIVSLASLPAMATAVSVDEFINRLPPGPKRGDLAHVMMNMRAILMDISKNRSAYPEGTDDLNRLVQRQLVDLIDHSPSVHTAEMTTFRDLARTWVAGEVSNLEIKK